jgi:hypothetical protein
MKAIKRLSPTVPTRNSHKLGLESSAVICATFIPKIELTSEMGTKLTENQCEKTLGTGEG